MTETHASSDYMEMPTGDGTIEMSVYRQPSDYMPIRLFHTPYEYGELGVTVDCETPPDYLADMPGGAENLRTHHTISLVMHPGQGVLVVVVAWVCEGIDGTEYVGKQYERAEMYCDWIREALDDSSPTIEPNPYWHGRELALGPAVAYGESDGADLDLAEVTPDPAIVLDANDWERLPSDLERAMGYHARGIDRPIDHAKHLVSAITRVGGRDWSYCDQVDRVAGMPWPAAQLLEPEG